jgi:hypothetical protein
MTFFSRGNNGRNNGGRGNWHQGHRRPRFYIHFDDDPQELNQIFQFGFFNLFGHGIFHSQHERPPFQQPHNFPCIHVPPHLSMQPKPPANDGWKEIVNQISSQRHGWPTVSFPLSPPPPLINPNAQISHLVSPVHSLHTNKRLKTGVPQHVLDNEKEMTSPSILSTKSFKSVSSCLHLKYDCSHVISAIQPQGSNQPRDTLEKSRGKNSEKRRYASHNKDGL